MSNTFVSKGFKGNAGDVELLKRALTRLLGQQETANIGLKNLGDIPEFMNPLKATAGRLGNLIPKTEGLLKLAKLLEAGTVKGFPLPVTEDMMRNFASPGGQI